MKKPNVGQVEMHVPSVFTYGEISLSHWSHLNVKDEVGLVEKGSTCMLQTKQFAIPHGEQESVAKV